jgi:DNA-binding PucR family transcriptional regulator
VQRLLDAVTGDGPQPAAVLSSACRRLSDLPHGLAECRALGTAPAGPDDAALRCADDLGVAKLVLGRIPPAVADRFVDDAFGAIADPAESTKLLETLDAFFAANRFVRATAARLGIHENTVRHRFRRLAAATGLDVLGSTDDQLTARLALTIHHLRCNTPVQKESV